MTASPIRRARGVVAGAVAVVGLALAGCGAGHPDPSTTTTIPRTSTTTVPTTTTTTTDPGTLPQTATEPPTDAAALIARLGPLWSAISSGDPAAGAGVFFPESAYLQLKTGILPNPAGDYTGRLVAFYDLDVAAYHLHVQSQMPAGSGPADLESVARKSGRLDFGSGGPASIGHIYGELMRKAMGVNLVKLSFLAMLAVCSATFLSFPVACLLSLMSS